MFAPAGEGKRVKFSSPERSLRFRMSGALCFILPASSRTRTICKHEEGEAFEAVIFTRNKKEAVSRRVSRSRTRSVRCSQVEARTIQERRLGKREDQSHRLATGLRLTR